MSAAIPVLMYHALCADEAFVANKNTVAISVKAFRKQMAWLHSNGYKAINLQEANSILKGNIADRGKYCILTFDDGYYSWYKYANDILAGYGFKATMFLSTAYVGELYDIPDFVLDDNDRPLTWQEVNQMSRNGWSVEAHGHYHHRWDTMSIDDLENDIQTCKELIEQNTGKRTTSVAYPYGSYNTQTLQLVKQMGFEAACTVHDGLLTSPAGNLRLPRIEINSSDTIASFQNKVCTGYASGRRAFSSKVRDFAFANPRVKDFIKALVK
ncbi:MAG: polysaccharide deacetylase family protein [Sphingobacteriales bacterium]|nr:MAG: polysaccharide deacetylase family protein [Sphingobacteriales bacterium]